MTKIDFFVVVCFFLFIVIGGAICLLEVWFNVSTFVPVPEIINVLLRNVDIYLLMFVEFMKLADLPA